MKVLVADDHPLYLNAVQVLLERLLNDTVVEVACDLGQALAKLGDGAVFDLVLLDYSMPGMNGTAGVSAAVRSARGVPVVVMSGVAAAADVGACIAAGARGFLPKTLDGKVFSSALNVVLTGGSYLPAEMYPLMCGPRPPPPEAGSRGEGGDCHGGFTERERTIMAMVVEGRSNKEIARLLNLREVTIKVQLTRIYKKLGAKNRAQAATLMAQANVLP